MKLAVCIVSSNPPIIMVWEFIVIEVVKSNYDKVLTIKKAPRLKRGAFYLKVVGETGFEPATPWSQTRCATGLRYSPIFLNTGRPRQDSNL